MTGGSASGGSPLAQPSAPGYGYAHPPPYGPAPGYPPPVWPPYPPFPPAAAPRPAVRHSPLGWAVVVVSVLAILVSGLAGVVRFAGAPSGPQVIWHAAEEALVPPPPDAPASEWSAWARRSATNALMMQASALRVGDADRFLSIVDPLDEQLREDLRRRYDVLRQMGVGQWSQDLRTAPDVTGDYSWRADVRVTYCFGDETCRPNSVEIRTEWRLDGDRLVLTDMAPAGADQAGPRPWEAGELAVATGDRTVVATSTRLDRRLEDTLAAAEEAAAVADSLARWDGPPSRYVVFLASAADWSTWYGFNQPEWAAGVYVNQTDNEVVINASVVPTADATDLLIHELTHVATLAGDRKGLGNAVWWLVEGVADYATMMGRSLTSYDGMSAVRSFVRRSWDGDPAVDQPSFGATTEEAAARYGVAFLAVWRMAEVYGQDAMLDFFGKVVHDDLTLDAAARQAFGESWETVRGDCEQFIRAL